MIRATLLALLLAQQDPVIRSTVVNVQVPVTVVDKKGNYLTGFTEKDFHLYDEGDLQKIQVDDVIRPISLVVAVQANTNARNEFPAIRKMSSLLGPLITGEAGEIAVLGFDHRIEVLAPFTSNAKEIGAAFDKLKPGSNPHHLDDAAMEAVRMLRTRGSGRKKVVLLIAEGFDEGSSVKPEDVFAEAERDDVLIYSVRMRYTKKAPAPPVNPVPPENRAPLPQGEMQTQTTDARVGTVNGNVFRGLIAGNNLAAYAEFTGARTQDFSNQKKLEQAIMNIGKEIHSQYLLTFAPQSRQLGYHKLTVQLTRRDLQIRSRQGYWLAAQPEVR
jgi:VWFA-related protein